MKAAIQKKSVPTFFDSPFNNQLRPVVAFSGLVAFDDQALAMLWSPATILS